jgi:hypothetical protein
VHEDKYGQYFIKSPVVQGNFGPRLVFFSRNYKAVGEKDYSVQLTCITEPFLMVNDPHSHDFDQFLHFFGADARDITDFDAIIEMSLGEEGEKHVITEPAVLHVPKNMIHCPLNFKVVNKPVVFMNVALTPEYMK